MAKKKIDLDKLHKLRTENPDMEQKEMAVKLGVSPAAISKALKRMPPAHEGFTEKEKAFIQAKARGELNGEAAMVAYECTSRESARSFGHQLMKREDVRTAIATEMEFLGLTRQHRLKRLKAHLDSKDPNVSLKALDMGFKLADEYPSQRHVVQHEQHEIFVVGYTAARRDGQEQLEEPVQDVEFECKDSQ